MNNEPRRVCGKCQAECVERMEHGLCTECKKALDDWEMSGPKKPGFGKMQDLTKTGRLNSSKPNFSNRPRSG